MASGTDDSELEHYKIGVANGGIALWTWYPESNKVWLSPHWKELVGYTLSEINVLGPTPESRSSLIHPEDREKVFAGMANHAETGEPFDMTFQVLHKNGTYRRIRSRAEAIRDKQGTQIGLGGAARDITDWYNSLQQLQDNEVMLHKLVQSNPVAMVIVSEADGSVTMMNDTFTELFGYSIEDIPTTESWWPQAYPDPTYREWVIKEWNKRLQEAHAGSPRLQPINCTVTCKDGSTRRIHFEAISLEGDYMVVFIDKTALWESEQLLSQITDNINDVFFLLSLDRSVVHYVSPGFEKLYGIPSQTIYDRPDSYMELVHHLDREELIKCFNGPPEEPYEVEVRIKRPNDGEIRWVQIRGVPVKNEKGEVYRIAGIAKDVSEERALEQEVMLASSASTRANINLHDLICTPLAGSAMSLRALKSQLPEELAKISAFCLKQLFLA